MFGSSSIYMHVGHSGKTVNRKRFIPVNRTVTEIRDNLSFCLPAVYALSGCDTTSFFKVGKYTAYTKLQSNIDGLLNLECLGNIRCSGNSYKVCLTLVWIQKQIL